MSKATNYHYNSSVFNTPVWFDPSKNKVFGNRDSGAPNTSFIPTGAMDGFKEQMSVIEEEQNENLVKSGDVALEVQDGFDANKINEIMEAEQLKYFSGNQGSIKERKITNPLDELVLKGNSDVAHSYLAPEKNPRIPGYQRGGINGFYRLNRLREGETLH